MAGLQFTELEAGARYSCLSTSGQTYTLTYAGSGDADPEYVGLWECDCPARVTCKHIKGLGLFLDEMD